MFAILCVGVEYGNIRREIHGVETSLFLLAMRYYNSVFRNIRIKFMHQLYPPKNEEYSFARALIWKRNNVPTIRRIRISLTKITQKNASNATTYRGYFDFSTRHGYKQDIYHSRFKLEASIRGGIRIGVLKEHRKNKQIARVPPVASLCEVGVHAHFKSRPGWTARGRLWETRCPLDGKLESRVTGRVDDPDLDCWTRTARRNAVQLRSQQHRARGERRFSILADFKWRTEPSLTYIGLDPIDPLSLRHSWKGSISHETKIIIIPTKK